MKKFARFVAISLTLTIGLMPVGVYANTDHVLYPELEQTFGGLSLEDDSMINQKNAGILTTVPSIEGGTRPYRPGVILVTPSTLTGEKNLTGHAGIILKGDTYIEATPTEGVVKKSKPWSHRYKKYYGLSVRPTSNSQDEAVAKWCEKQVGKPYNFNYANCDTERSFYCSQLVWKGYKKIAGVDLDTDTLGSIVAPMELYHSSKTKVVYTYKG